MLSCYVCTKSTSKKSYITIVCSSVLLMLSVALLPSATALTRTPTTKSPTTNSKANKNQQKPSTYYVSGQGNDNNDGLSAQTAFRTLQKGADVAQPGDTVYMMNGVYTRDDQNKEILVIYKKNGSPNAWLSFKAYPGHTPKIKSRNTYAINIVGSSYVLIEGLNLKGNNDNITLEYALQQKDNLNNPLTYGQGIGLNPSFSASGIDGRCHNIVIRNNKISKFGGVGIGAYQADYVTIENNVVSENSWYTPRGNSGIHLIYNWNSDNNTGYKMVLRDNIIYNNKSLVPWQGRITEGHGIIIDDSRNTQSGSTRQLYIGRTLIENNLVYKNGGGGINVSSSAYVDVVNNTTYLNAQTPGIGMGEISAAYSDNVRVFNNIMYAQPNAKPGELVNNTIGATNVTYNYNLVFNAAQFTSNQANNILNRDPLFSDPSAGKFSLKAGSPAINTGTSTLAAKDDISGTSRPQGNAIDMGAYEQ